MDNLYEFYNYEFSQNEEIADNSTVDFYIPKTNSTENQNYSTCINMAAITTINEQQELYASLNNQ